jgi:hypothetical protein
MLILMLPYILCILILTLDKHDLKLLINRGTCCLKFQIILLQVIKCTLLYFVIAIINYL